MQSGESVLPVQQLKLELVPRARILAHRTFFLLGIFDDASHCGEILCTLKTAKKKSLFHPFLLPSAANTVAIDQVVPVCVMVAPV